MFRKLLTLFPVVAFTVFTAPDSDACCALDVYGTAVNPDPDDWNAPKEAPHAKCKSLMLYLADAPADPAKVRRYRFTGTCQLNVARQGKLPKMMDFDVEIDAEYHPRLKRASERLAVKHPDITLDLSTWATCPSDPFVGTAVVCTDKGMGATKWDKFINKDDAPFAHQRATQLQVDAAASRFAKAKQAGATDADFFKAPAIFRLQPLPKHKAGEEQLVTLESKGAAGMCPSEVDYGDGTKERLVIWGMSPFAHQTKHTWSKPGFYKVTARSLAGCTGEALVYVLVK